MVAPIMVALKGFKEEKELNPAESLVWLCLKNNGMFKTEKQGKFLREWADRYGWIYTSGRLYWRFECDEQGVVAIWKKTDLHYSGMTVPGRCWVRK